MDLGLRDRVAIICGSSRGIGKAIAIALAREGASVTICGRAEADLRRTEIELARLSSQHHVLAIPADLTVERDIRRVVRDTINRFGHVSVLVTRTGPGPEGRPSELDEDTLAAGMDQTFHCAMRMDREAAPYMKQQHWGRIIHLLPTQVRQASGARASSLSGQMALVGYSKALANELAISNITVNNILVGRIKTEFFTKSLEEEAEAQGRNAKELLEEACTSIPMGRAGAPEEVGDLVAFLASERAGYITGANIVIDGGDLQTLD